MSPGTTPVSRAGERRLLFVCIPMAGHLNPLLQPAKLLMQRPGHAVLLAAHEQMRSAVEAAGIPFASLGPDTAQHSCEHQHMVVDALATRRERMQALSAMYTGVLCR
jgi:UDP:flavonoid glycosyltransferase YjiC (YdhE family)